MVNYSFKRFRPTLFLSNKGTIYADNQADSNKLSRYSATARTIMCGQAIPDAAILRQSMKQFQACPGIMVAAFPKTCFILLHF